MDDEEPDQTPHEKPWYSPNHKSARDGNAPPPKPRERLWTVVKGGRHIDAELLKQGEAGVELQFMLNGDLARACRFAFRDRALAEAAARRVRLLGEGWTLPAVHPSSASPLQESRRER